MGIHRGKCVLSLQLDCLVEGKARTADWDPNVRGSWVLCQAVNLGCGGEPWKFLSWEHLDQVSALEEVRQHWKEWIRRGRETRKRRQGRCGPSRTLF